jgi:hypothetical protein
MGIPSQRWAIALLALVLAVPAILYADQDWEFVMSSEGVDVYQRDAEEIGGIAFRGEMEADVHIGELLTVFIDPDERPHWVYRYGEDEMLHRDEDRDLKWSESYWVRVDMPFPTTDRDYVFYTEYEIDEEEKVVYALIESVEDEAAPERDCCVRARSRTNYTVEPVVGEEKTRITVEVETDLGGSLPGWITRRAEREWPVETLTALVERAQADGVEVDQRVSDWHEE